MKNGTMLIKLIFLKIIFIPLGWGSNFYMCNHLSPLHIVPMNLLNSQNGTSRMNILRQMNDFFQLNLNNPQKVGWGL